MITASMTQAEYEAQQAAQSLTADEKLTRLTSDSQQLKTRSWTDEELQSIPENLVEFAFQNSATLQREFGDFEKFLAYRRAVARGQVGSTRR